MNHVLENINYIAKCHSIVFATFLLKIVIEGNPVTVHPGFFFKSVMHSKKCFVHGNKEKNNLMKHFQSLILHFNLKCQQGSNDLAN